MSPPAPSRRDLLAAAAALGVGSSTFHRAVAAEAAAEPMGPVTVEMIKNAEWVAGIELTDEQRKAIAGSLTSLRNNYAALHKAKVGNEVPPALYFNADPWSPPPAKVEREVRPGVYFGGLDEVKRPATDEDLAFASLTDLAALIQAKKVSSVELTKLYLARLEKYDPALKCVVSLTADLALKQAKAADAEIVGGKYRGPLHGVPWAAKDLIAYPGYKTTWGAARYKDQTLDDQATVAERLDAAGAVLAAKVTLGALAWGDAWYGGMTRNPWNVKQGSSGSSAGSASAVAAGLAGFAIGSETWGSIVSPCTRCGVSGLRPTFGRVSRAGCMALSWSMDKIGPIARSVNDLALVFSVIHGADGKDATAQTRPFAWPCPKPLKEIRVGYTGGEASAETREELKVLKSLGVKLVPISLTSPSNLPLDSLQLILTVEAAAAFDDPTLDGAEGLGMWPATFRRGRFIPAVEYLRAQRVRTLVMREMAAVMEKVDLYVLGGDSLLTNLTGHPTVVLPNGLRKAKDGESPTAITFTGRLWGESELLAVARAYQEATGHHLKRPDMSKVTKENAEGK